MQPLAEAVHAVLDRHPAPALSLDDLSALLERELPRRPPPPEGLLDTLRQRSDLFRVLEPRPRLWIGAPPHRWVVGRRAGGPAPPRSLAGRMRESLRRIGEATEPECTRSVARWERYLLEEAEARHALDRSRAVTPPPPPSLRPAPARRRRGGTRRSTTSPRGPRRRG